MPTLKRPYVTLRRLRRTHFITPLAFLALAAILPAGCSRGPNVRKQKFVAEGDKYFKDGKYPEAQISYSRALQLDRRYTVALYKSAQRSEERRVGKECRSRW